MKMLFFEMKYFRNHFYKEIMSSHSFEINFFMLEKMNKILIIGFNLSMKNIFLLVIIFLIFLLERFE